MTTRFDPDKFDVEDDRDLNMHVGLFKGCVIIDFGESIPGMVITPEQAFAFATELLRLAMQATAQHSTNPTEGETDDLPF